MVLHRREWLQLAAGGVLAASGRGDTVFAAESKRQSPLKITGLKITPIALPDPPLLMSGGCHGPYFLRNIVQIETDAGIFGIGETKGGQRTTDALEKAREIIVGQNAFAYRTFTPKVEKLSPAAVAGIELACLDACGKATGLRLSELLGGPVREQVEFAAYLFYRYAADHPKVLADSRLVDDRGRGDKALDNWGEVRSPESMANEAERMRREFGFRVFKLKAGVLTPDQELETMRAMNAKFGGKLPLRIDPNAKWKVETSIRIGNAMKDLPLEYYEDPVAGQAAMAEVRKATGLRMSTNMCVIRFEHIPGALKLEPIDVVLCDHHYWGGIPACQELGRICETVGWGMSQHSNNHAGITMAAMIHVGALSHQLTYPSDTHYPWLPPSFDIIQGPKLVIRDGHMQVPAAPGVGVSLDPDKLARAHEIYRKCGMRERDDDFTMKMIDPNWHAEVR